MNEGELRVRLEHLYPTASNAGVAQAVRARLAAGDAGYSPPRGGTGWIPWIAGALLVGVVATGTGVVLASPETAAASYSSTVVEGTEGYACPGSDGIAFFPSGTRVVAVRVSPDGAWVQLSGSAWVSAGDLVADGDLAALPVGGCATSVVDALSAPATPIPVATAPPADTIPASDATAPALSGASVAYSPAQGFVCTEQPASVALVSVSASDDVRVASVAASWGGSQPGSGSLAPSGAQWVLSYRPTNLSITESIPVTLVAHDAAGNASAPLVVTVQRDQCPG